MVKLILIDAAKLNPGDVEITENHVIRAISLYDCESPYGMAKRLGLLRNGSAEDMAIEFMTFVNKIFPNYF